MYRKEVMARYNLVIVLMFVFLIPAANALSVSVSVGNGQSGIGAKMTYGSTLKDFATQDIKLGTTNPSMENYWAFSGSGSTSRSATGASGGTATSGFSVTGNSNTYTTYDFASSSWPYAVTSETLTSTHAYYIDAYAQGGSSAGDVARVETILKDPNYYAYLYKYANTAVGTSSNAYASQSLNSGGYGRVYSSNGYTETYENAQNRYNDRSYLYNYRYYGYLYYLPYSSSWPSAAYSDSSQTHVQTSDDSYGYYYNGYAFAYAKPNYYTATTYSNSISNGWHPVYQSAYTTSGYYKYAINYVY